MRNTARRAAAAAGAPAAQSVRLSAKAARPAAKPARDPAAKPVRDPAAKPVREPAAKPVRGSTANGASATTSAADGLGGVLSRLDALVSRIERLVPQPAPPTDWKAAIAFRWRKRDGRGYVQPVLHMHKIDLADLRGVDRQKRLIEQNTRQFVGGLPANNVLLTGARGT